MARQKLAPMECYCCLRWPSPGFPQTTLEWNAAKLKFSLKEANQLLRRKYRKGWEVAGL